MSPGRRGEHDAGSSEARLPRDLWFVEAGAFIGALGFGAILPFIVIFLHDHRDFSWGAAGGVLFAMNAVGMATAPLAGTLSERVGPRATLVAAVSIQGFGYGGIAFASGAGATVAAAVVGGAGRAMYFPAESIVLARLSTEHTRHRIFGLQRLVANLGLGLGGLLGGIAIAGGATERYEILFGMSALASLVSILPISHVSIPPDRSVEARGVALSRPARRALADRSLRLALVATTGFFVCAYGFFEIALPPFAANTIGLGAASIGSLFFVNTIVIVVAQLRVARLVRWRSPQHVLAAASAVWAACWLLALSTMTMPPDAAFAALLVVAAAFALAECLHAAVFSAMLIDLAPPSQSGRYLALSASAQQLGGTIAPLVGVAALGWSPAGLWSGAAMVLLAIAAALTLSKHLRHRVGSATAPATPALSMSNAHPRPGAAREQQSIQS